MVFHLRQLIAAVCQFEINYDHRSSSKWECETCGRGNPVTERECLKCREARTPDSRCEWMGPDGPLDTTTDRWKWYDHCEERRRRDCPRTLVRDVLRQEFQRLILAGVKVPDDILAEAATIQRDSKAVSAIEARMRKIGETSVFECTRRDDDGTVFSDGGFLDLFQASLDELDRQGLCVKLLGDIWHRFPEEAAEIGLPEPDEVAVPKPQRAGSRSMPRRRKRATTKGRDLTEKQVRVLELFNDLDNIAEVARRLNIASSTVRQQLKAAYAKIGTSLPRKARTQRLPTGNRGEALISDSSDRRR